LRVCRSGEAHQEEQITYLLTYSLFVKLDTATTAAEARTQGPYIHAVPSYFPAFSDTKLYC